MGCPIRSALVLFWLGVCWCEETCEEASNTRSPGTRTGWGGDRGVGGECCGVGSSWRELASNLSAVAAERYAQCSVVELQVSFSAGGVRFDRVGCFWAAFGPSSGEARENVFDASRRAFFRVGIASALSAIDSDDVGITSITDVIAKRRRRLLQSMAVDIDYYVFVDSLSNTTLVEVSSTLNTAPLLTSLQSSGLVAVTAVSTAVRALPSPPPSPPPAPSISGSASQNISANATLTVAEQDPDFSGARVAGLFAGAAAMLFTSVAYQYRQSMFNLFQTRASKPTNTAGGSRKSAFDDKSSNAAEDFITKACE